jgi:phage-related protein
MEIYDQIGSENITGFITTISDAIQAVIPYIKEAVQFVLDNKYPIIAALSGIAAGIVAVTAIQGIMKMVGAFKAFFALIKGGQGIMAAFNAVVGLNPFVLIAGAVIGLVAALVVLFNTNEDFRNKVIEVWGNVKEFVGNAIDAIGMFFTETLPAAIDVMVSWFAQLPGKIAGFVSQVWANVTAWARNMVAKAKELGTKFLTNVVTFFQQLPYRVGYFIGQALGFVIVWVSNMVAKAKELGTKFVTNVVTFFQQLPGKIAAFITTAWNSVVLWATNMVAKAKETGRNFLNGVVTFVKELPGKIATFTANAIAKVVAWAGQMASNAKTAGSNFVSNVVSFVQQLPGKIWDLLTSAAAKVAAWAGDLASKGASAATSLFNAVVNGLASLPDKITSIGSSIVQGLWNGINGMYDWVIGQIKGFGQGIVDGLKDFLGIESPSKLMRDEVGKMLAEGIAVGFGSEMPDTLRSMRKSMSGTVDALRGSISVAADGTLGNRASYGAIMQGAQGGAGDKVQNVNFTQIINSPKPVDRLSIYRDTKSIIFTAKGGLAHV